MVYSHKLNPASTSLELELILSCLRSFNGEECGDHITALCRKGIDWQIFTDLVDRHRLVSPVHQSLKPFVEDIVPESVRTALNIRFARNVKQVLMKAAEFVRIVKRFDDNGIRALPLKGPVVALQAYGDLGSRHVGDLDIMVPPERVLEAHRILLQEGYQRTHPGFELTPRQDRVYIRFNHHFGYFNPEKGIRVELHWRFGLNRYLFPIPFNALWKDRQTTQLGGADIATLSLEHTIFLLCTHGGLHAWFRLFWLNDVAHLLMKHEHIAWEALMRNAIQLGIERMLAEGMVLAHRLLDLHFQNRLKIMLKKTKPYPLFFLWPKIASGIPMVHRIDL